MGCCERERDCCDLRDELAECCEVAEARRHQRDYVTDQLKATVCELAEERAENCRLRGELDECRHHKCPRPAFYGGYQALYYGLVGENQRLREELVECHRRLSRHRPGNCGNGRFSAGCCN